MRVIGKTLITKRNIEEYFDLCESEVYLKKDMILTSGAKDIIRNRGITICYGEKDVAKANEEKLTSCCYVDLSENLDYDECKVTCELVKLLTDKYEITDVSVIQQIIERVLQKLG